MKDVSITSSDGLTLHASCEGTADRSLVFVHGWSQSSIVWSKQVEGLSKAFRIIRYDLRGHGASDRPQNIEAYNERWIHADDIAAVTDHFEPNKCVVLIGWSFGAIAASDAAIRLGAERVCGLVLVAGPPEAGTDRARASFGPLFAETAAMSNGPAGEAEQRAVETFLSASYLQPWDPELYPAILDANLSLSPEDRVRVVARPSYSNIEALNASGIPVLIIHGAGDSVMLPSLSESVAKDLETAELRLYEDVGHWPFLEAEDQFNKDIENFANKVFQAK